MRRLNFLISDMNRLHFKLVLCLFYFFVYTSNIYAQDTLFFKKQGNIVVIIQEISQTEIKYFKKELPNGPIFTINKNEIEKIVYQNGYSEIISNTSTFDAEKQFEVIRENAPLNYNKMTFEDSKNTHYRLVSLANRHPDESRRSDLIKLAEQIKKINKQRDISRASTVIAGGLAVAGAAFFGLTYSTLGTDMFAPVAGQPIVFGSLAVVLGSTTLVINLNLNKKRKSLVELYNK